MDSNPVFFEVLALETPKAKPEDPNSQNPNLPNSSEMPESDSKLPICPRIGPEFQVEIPSHPNPYPVPADNPFLLGLPVPLTCQVNLPPLPSLPPPSVSWTEKDKDSFLLGLYIFGKNLKLVRRFTETKEMGDVLEYYYGEQFYKREQYKKWAECRKVKTRRCIIGTRLFTGWRQNEIISRLRKNISQDHLALLELVKLFNENTIPFEEFIFSLKDKIGLESFISTIGIGKGRYDLTGTGPDSTRSVNPVPARPEIPSGKNFSSLSSSEIIKYLTGDFRLSKAKSNDLFWEAIWPRLLVTGWHSEQPKELNGSKNSLVFIKPGIKKFSRNKLNKGEHYYDCVSDVLKLVASDPGLIEVDGVTPCSGSVSRPVSKNELLREREESFGEDLLQFMVVDTSLLRVREMKGLPNDVGLGFGPDMIGPGLDDLSDSEGEKKVRKKRRGRKGNLLTGVKPMKGTVVDNKASTNGHVENVCDLNSQEGHFGNFGESSKPPKSKHKYLSPVIKRRRLNACKNDRKNVSLFKESNNNNNGEEERHNGSGLTGQQPAKETDHPTRKRKVKFLVKDMMQEGEAFDASLLETGQTSQDKPKVEAGQTGWDKTKLGAGQKGRDELKVGAGQMGRDKTKVGAAHTGPDEPKVGAGQTGPSEKRKRKVNFVVREPSMVQEGNEIKQVSSERIEKVSAKSEKKTEPVRPVSEMGLPNKEIKPVREEGSTKRRRKVTFVVRETMQVEKEAMSIKDSVSEPKSGQNLTRFEPGPPVKEKKVRRRKPKSESLTEEAKVKKPRRRKENRLVSNVRMPETVPSDTGMRLVERKEIIEPQQVAPSVPHVCPAGTSETKVKETKPTELNIIKEEPREINTIEEVPQNSSINNVAEIVPSDSRTDNKPSVPVPEPEPVQNEAGSSGRRVGTRNRPPTVRALEAFASGLLGGPKQRKVPKASRRSKKTGEPSRRYRKKGENNVEPVQLNNDDVVELS